MEGYIYNATQSRIDKGNRRTNPFSLDNIEIHYTENYIECFMGYPFFNEYTYTVHDEKKTAQGIPYETKRIYVNTEACKRLSTTRRMFKRKTTP